MGSLSVRLSGTARVFFRGEPLDLREVADHERLAQVLAAALPRADLELAVSLGRTLPFALAAERAIAFARERSAGIAVPR